MKIRKTARVVLINDSNEVLLQRVIPLDTEKYGNECWIAPGGKIEEGETIEACALRELYEETGIKADKVERILWHSSHVMELEGVDTIFDEYFVLIRANERLSVNEGDDESIVEHRWWRVEELKDQKTMPRNLQKLLLSIESLKMIQEIEM